jgi:hypothetical protein
VHRAGVCNLVVGLARVVYTLPALVKDQDAEHAITVSVGVANRSPSCHPGTMVLRCLSSMPVLLRDGSVETDVESDSCQRAERAGCPRGRGSGCVQRARSEMRPPLWRCSWPSAGVVTDMESLPGFATTEVPIGAWTTARGCEAPVARDGPSAGDVRLSGDGVGTIWGRFGDGLSKGTNDGSDGCAALPSLLSAGHPGREGLAAEYSLSLFPHPLFVLYAGWGDCHLPTRVSALAPRRWSRTERGR